VVVRIRDDQPVNLVGAFEDAVEATGDRPRLEAASSRLVEHARSVDAAYGDGGGQCLVVRVGTQTAPLGELGEQVSLEELVSRTAGAVNDYLAVTP
jgi:CRISPR system Cascade subunit CasC